MGLVRATLRALCVLAANVLVPGRVATVVAQVGSGATLSVLAAGVDVSPQGGGFSTAADGQTLRPGDQVRTDASGVALLTFFDGSETQLTPSTELTVDAAAPGNPTSLFHVIGTVASRVIPPPNNGFGVDSAAAAALVRGTTYVVTVR